MASRKIEKKKPVGLDATASPSEGVKVELKSIKSIEAEAQGPGEVSGPALSFTVLVTNSSDSAAELGAVSVNLTDSRGNPGSAMAGPPATTFPVSLASGEDAEATFVFAVADNRRDPITLDVSLGADLPTLLFEGKP